MTYRKKLIEVSLPLEAINVASAREKSIRHGHPSTLHLWWARRPLAACRAVLFSSLVDDPSEYMPDEESARIERERLFDIIEDLVLWENIHNDEVLDRAKIEIARSVARSLNVDVPVGKEAVREFLATKAPPVLDPFAGGGSIPLEAQRLGLRAYASDLNPVAVLINKAMIEIPPKFSNRSPVHPPESSLGADEGQGNHKKHLKKPTVPQEELWQKQWKGAQGLAEDVRYYGKWMRDEAFKRIGHLYPPVTITKEMLAERPDLKEQGFMAGDQQNVIAWLWARTVKCPNPACGAQMPLVSSFWLKKKKGQEIWLKPNVLSKNDLTFSVQVKKAQPDIDFGTGFVNDKGKKAKATFVCLHCHVGIAKGAYIDDQANKGLMSTIPLALVVEGIKSKIYLPFGTDHTKIISDTKELYKNLKDEIPSAPARGTFASNAQGRIYGFKSFSDYFTERQLVTLVNFGWLLDEVFKKIMVDSQNDQEYAIAIITYLSISVDRLADISSSLASWIPQLEAVRNTFARQAISMAWDFAECNPIYDKWDGTLNWIINSLTDLPANPVGIARQMNATELQVETSCIISTDPPYYGNVAYSDLSDFFYVWMRRSLSSYYPNLFATTLTPKNTELVATPFRFETKEEAAVFFETGIRKVFGRIIDIATPEIPITVYYAFKQSEDDGEDIDDAASSVASTGWETMLEGLLSSGAQITGTWPMKTERSVRTVSINTNSLASSIILVCRSRPKDSPFASRREFLSGLKKELAPALRELQQGSIAPVDLAQAAIGPGMAIYSRYSAVLEADGRPMSVRTALTLINQALDEFLAEQEGEYDGDTRWALTWFEQYGHNEAAYGVAETLSRAKNTSVDGLNEAGIVEARGGKVRLYRRDELDKDWDPTQDKRLTAWESAAHLIYALENGGEESAAGLLAKLGPVAEIARDLAYRLYTVCERKGWAQDALGYNMLVVAWPRLKELAAQHRPQQANLL